MSGFSEKTSFAKAPETVAKTGISVMIKAVPQGSFFIFDIRHLELSIKHLLMPSAVNHDATVLRRIFQMSIPNNRLLSALDSGSFRKLHSKLETVPLEFGKDIYQPGEISTFVYFPESGIISLLSSVETDSTLEVGIVGNEGMVGIGVFLGVEKANNHALVQGEGTAFRMRSADLQAAVENDNQLRRVINLYVHSLITQISQTAACNRYHDIESRLARWLLMTQDRMRSDEFRITQEFLSNMLGVRREAVSKAAAGLQSNRLISYSRGNLSILNRKDLEKTACRCYRVIKKDYDDFLKESAF